jgi:hypothetical protein
LPLATTISRYRFELANPKDDADLRSVLAATPMAGRISVSFQREPSWFAGAVVDGWYRQTLVCRDVATCKVVGLACRSIRDVYLNGRPGSVGYLSSLRLLPEHRNLGLVARGYAFLRELHADGRTPLYLTTIAEGNHTALNVLTSGRAGLPRYHPAGAYHTVAIAVPRRGGRFRARNVSVRPATIEDLDTVLEFLTAVGSGWQFFPCLKLSDFLSPQGTMSGLSPQNLFLAERGGRIVGTLAGWDQHAYRQSVVHSYSGCLRWARPFYNVWGKATNRPGLPEPGEPFRYLTGALPVIAGDDCEVFLALLETLRASAAGGPWSHVLIGLHEANPLLRLARRHQAACYVTRVFLACWPDGEAARAALDDRPPYLEAGSL